MSTLKHKKHRLIAIDKLRFLNTTEYTIFDHSQAVTLTFILSDCEN